MSAPIIFSAHAIDRLRTRLSITDPQTEIHRISDMRRDLFHLSNGLLRDGRAASYKLLFLLENKKFAVLVVTTKFEDEIATHHDIVTVITPEMYAETKGIIKDKNFMHAAELSLGPVEYRNWSKEKYGFYENFHSERLAIFFQDKASPYEVKIKQALCKDFIKKESIERYLAHPGSLTKVHQVLSDKGRKVEDRKYMRFDHIGGEIKMVDKIATKCPYCGLEPLETDLPIL